MSQLFSKIRYQLVTENKSGKNTLMLLFFLFLFMTSFSQETKFKEYSYSEFFNLIANEKDSVFRLNDAIIKFNKETDSLFVLNTDSVTGIICSDQRKYTLTVDKTILLNNVHFIQAQDLQPYGNNMIYGVLNNIHFKKKVQLLNSVKIYINNCVFNKFFRISSGARVEAATKYLASRQQVPQGIVTLENSILKESADISFVCMDIPNQPISLSFNNNEIHLSHKGVRDQDDNLFYMFVRNIFGMSVQGNRFMNKGFVHFRSIENSTVFFMENEIMQAVSEIFVAQNSGFNTILIDENSFHNTVLWNIDKYDPKYSIPFNQFKDYLIIDDNRNTEKYMNNRLWWESDSLLTLYKKDLLENDRMYKTEMSQKGMMYDFYRSKHDKEDANALYMQIKDLETNRLEYLYHKSPSFKTFFKWKINQFLKIFADYGTEPSKAIIFSLYVILFFALIYLFFPNSWDSHGKHRIIHRYTFFMKYLNRNQGIHEVYLEEKQPELLAFHEFKEMIENNAKTVPRFFTATALPLYKWALSGTKLTASVLSRFDVLKGTWQEVPPSRRWWKVILLVGAFLIAIFYDVIIKILNALMLSINTFTTLGFGEIPIKGLPRYLAIIQGFIGWFMLTIFSVSLISQLLN